MPEKDKYMSVSVRLDAPTLARLKDILEPIRQQRGHTVDRATIIREAILRGLTILEKEVGKR